MKALSLFYNCTLVTIHANDAPLKTRHTPPGHEVCMLSCQAKLESFQVPCQSKNLPQVACGCNATMSSPSSKLIDANYCRQPTLCFTMDRPNLLHSAHLLSCNPLHPSSSNKTFGCMQFPVNLVRSIMISWRICFSSRSS